ncbi:GGDEF domain-containing protein [Kineosporia rhizophila]|uniref:GGDEF domain-containing protein n=1 Tax=Kineosporia TaxID=49184 RepID=UPI001E461E02|nr:GGDEF domain-containing protein [Kineosporia sp. NBRC 101677]MCE0539142.1 GGDEF domain-containing protein [Kineosporia rhizophila]
MSPAYLAPRAGDATSLGLPRLCLGFAAIHAVSAVLGLFMEIQYRGVLIAVDGVCALLFVLIAFMASSRRLPGWRRETAAAVVPIMAASAACARAGLIDQYWPAAELIVAAAAACVVSARNWFWSVLAACGALWVGCVATAAARGGFTVDEAARWVNVLLLVIAAGVLAAAVRRARTSAAMALVDAHRQVMEQSVKDPLTGVANRKGLELVARPMIDLARRQGHAVHALVVDVDTLRGINEEHGIRDGDEVLVAVAQALGSATRATDVVARWAGDEFVMIGPGTGTSPLEMERRIRAHLAETLKLPKETWQGRVSAGIATLVPWDADDLEGLLERAIQDLSLRRSLKRRAAARMAEEDEALTNVPAPDVPEKAGKPEPEA